MTSDASKVSDAGLSSPLGFSSFKAMRRNMRIAFFYRITAYEVNNAYRLENLTRNLLSDSGPAVAQGLIDFIYTHI